MATNRLSRRGPPAHCGAVLPAILIALAAGAGRPAAGQAAASDPVRAVFRTTERGTPIRLSADDGRTVEGRLLETAPGVVVLESGGGPTRIRTTAIEEIWIRGRATTRGTVIGAMTGGAGGLGVGLVFGFLAVHLCESQCPNGGVGHYLAWGAGGMLAGSAAGAGVGALIGSATPRWERAYP